jgi:hypothetical protein
MAAPVEFFGQNQVIQPHPKDKGKVLPLPVHQDPRGFVIACWQLTPEEIEEVKRTGKIFLQINGRIPPHSVMGKNPFINNEIKGN